MARKPSSVRRLEAHGIPYEVLSFPETLHSAQEVADHLGLSPAQVYKTLVVLPPQGQPLLIMVAADRQLRLRELAKVLGIKKLRMATYTEAESLTGLRVGGISALAVQPQKFAVYIDRAAEALDTVLIGAGQRGKDLRLKVTDLLKVTGATFVAATAPEP
jgi:Cys-tRNA(Pro)/Cys-tRNA(Cys) deacylase